MSGLDRPASHPMRDVRLGPLAVSVDRRPDGTIYVTPAHPLAPYPAKLTLRLEHWAAVAPDRVFLAERDGEGRWRKITYAEALAQVRLLGAALLSRGLSVDRPLMILSGNDIEHGLLGLAALYVGVPYVPVSPAYSTVSTDFGKLRHIIGLVTPGLVFAADGGVFARAIAAVVPAVTEVVVTRHPPATRRVTPFASLLGESDDRAVDAAQAAVGPETVAKILFTSGSTGLPKGVINTQRMLCANMEQILSQFAFFRDAPPIIVDWCPWHHTAGGNHNFNIGLYNGGSFYIDEGKPVPGGTEATIRNLRDISPSWYFNVPRGYEALIPFLRDDKQLRESFFRNLRLMYYAGAGMAQHIWDALAEIAVAACGERILMLTGLGATETAPFALSAGREMSGAGIIGLPVPGVALKLVPVGGKLEARVRGPNVTPGYWRQPDLTAKAFDEEGYYKFGDALKPVDPTDIAKGLLFDGRVAEDFKLATGTWVSVGALRSAFIAHFAPYVQDVVLTGHDRDEIGVLVFPNLAACRSLCGDSAAGASVAELLRQPGLRAEFHSRLLSLAGKSTGSSNRITRALLLDEPPSIDLGELTDKGSINQQAVLTSRHNRVTVLYACPADRAVIGLAGGAKGGQ